MGYCFIAALTDAQLKICTFPKYNYRHMIQRMDPMDILKKIPFAPSVL